MKKFLVVLFAISLVFGIFGLSASAHASLWTEEINDLPESTSYTWGDGINDLTTEWSTHQCSGGDGWFYGSDYSWSDVDFYVYDGLIDPTTISDATIFTYNSSCALADEGDTVFFRGTNGYYGAWRIDEIYPNPLGDQSPYTYLNGQWYFQDDGTGNFVPIPGAVWLFGSGLIGVAAFRKKFKK